MTVFKPFPTSFSCGAPTFTRLGKVSSAPSMSHPCSEFLVLRACVGRVGVVVRWCGGVEGRGRGSMETGIGSGGAKCQQPWIVGWGCVVQQFRAQTQTLFSPDPLTTRSIPSSSGVTWLESSGRLLSWSSLWSRRAGHLPAGDSR